MLDAISVCKGGSLLCLYFAIKWRRTTMYVPVAHNPSATSAPMEMPAMTPPDITSGAASPDGVGDGIAVFAETDVDDDQEVEVISELVDIIDWVGNMLEVSAAVAASCIRSG